jgi:hypothetical protein
MSEGKLGARSNSLLGKNPSLFSKKNSLFRYVGNFAVTI